MACGESTSVRALTALLRQADTLCNQGEVDRAIPLYTQALRSAPASTDALVGRGTAYRLKGNLTGALRDFERALREDPRCAAAYNNRAYVLRLMGRYGAAVKAYREAASVSPTSPSRWSHLADCEMVLGRYADASRHYQASLALRRDQSGVRLSLGRAYALLGRGAQARASTQAGLRRATVKEVSQARSEALKALRRHPQRAAPADIVQLLNGAAVPQGLRSRAGGPQAGTGPPRTERDSAGVGAAPR